MQIDSSHIWGHVTRSCVRGLVRVLLTPAGVAVRWDQAPVQLSDTQPCIHPWQGCTSLDTLMVHLRRTRAPVYRLLASPTTYNDLICQINGDNPGRELIHPHTQHCRVYLSFHLCLWDTWGCGYKVCTVLTCASFLLHGRCVGEANIWLMKVLPDTLTSGS